MKKYITKRVIFYFLTFLAVTLLLSVLIWFSPADPPMAIILGKPVIYLYPEEETEVFVDVSVDNGEIFVTYPEKHDGWNVVAHPGGKIIDENGMTHSYLFWEAKSDFSPDFSSGFVVAGKNSAEFLQEKLSFMGLNQNEINEFIVYWLPQMIDNPYNLVSFQGENYGSFAPLTVSPQPDSVLRVFMALKPLDKPVNIQEQVLVPFERTGFTVVEWGGSIVN